MSGIINAKAGYGWSTTGTTALDDKGVKFVGGVSTKVIYVDEQKINPVYIHWQCRIYNDKLSTSYPAKFSMSVTGLLIQSPVSTVATTGDISIAVGSSTLITIEGYAISDVTVTLTDIGGGSVGTISIYPMNELGV